MITPVSPLLAMLIYISTSCWTICRLFETILEMGTVRWTALQIQRSVQIHCFKKHSVRYELCFKIYFIALGSSDSDGWARVKRKRSRENAYYERYCFVQVTCKATKWTRKARHGTKIYEQWQAQRNEFELTT